jgi:uncharacterized protein YdcH (DUF465 family)
MLQTEALKEEMIASDDTFRRLYKKHQNYKQQLQDIRLQPLHSPEDEEQVKRIKIDKLRLKDRMQAMMRLHQQEDLEHSPPN